VYIEEAWPFYKLMSIAPGSARFCLAKVFGKQKML